MADPLTAAANAPGAAEPLLDPAALELVASLQRPGAPDLVARVLGLFRDDAARLVADTNEAIAAFDVERAGVAAHTLKSSAANVGATRLSMRCALIERAARAMNPIACTALADALETLLADTLAEIDRRHGPAQGADAGAGSGAAGRRAA